MPGNPRTPGKATNRGEKISSPSTTKVADIGEPLGIHDVNSVRDRVRQWQAQGGGVVTALDVYNEDGQEHDTSDKTCANGKIVLKTSAVKGTGLRVSGSETPRSRNGRQHRRSSGQAHRHDRSKSAPAKRVVSDAHWRRIEAHLRTRHRQRQQRDQRPGGGETWTMMVSESAQSQC